MPVGREGSGRQPKPEKCVCLPEAVLEIGCIGADRNVVTRVAFLEGKLACFIGSAGWKKQSIPAFRVVDRVGEDFLSRLRESVFPGDGVASRPV